MLDDMKDEAISKVVVLASAQAGSFASMTAEQLLAFTRNPPRAYIPPADPTVNARKLSQVSASELKEAERVEATSAVKGRTAYHRKKKCEVTILASAGEGKLEVKKPDGSTFIANTENLTLL